MTLFPFLFPKEIQMNSRHENVTPSYVMDIVKEAAKYDDAIHFEIGRSDLLPSLKVSKSTKLSIYNQEP